MCEDQYFWLCDKCTTYGPCDDLINATCGCISGVPDDGQFCQPITELTNGTTCLTPPTNQLPPPATSTLEYIVVVEVNVSEMILIQQLKSALNIFSFQIDNTTTISALEISTVCYLNNTGYQCTCEDKYFWLCDKCTTYGPCDDLINATCGCIRVNSDDGQFCQPITELTNGTCPSPTLPPEPSSKYIVEIEVWLPKHVMVSEFKKLLMNFSVPVTMDNGVNITEISITTDINECIVLASVCGPNSVCNNTLGGYRCSCLTGFVPSNLSQNVSTNNPCQDINECVGLSSVCGQNSVCNNTLGGYSCSCLSGFAQTNLSQNVSTNNPCQDINECVGLSSVCGQNSVCNNTLGGYSCSCLSGFAQTNLSQNVSMNSSCQDINECVGLSSVCGQNSVCNNTLGGYSCSCLSGFAQTNLSQNVSTNNPCQDINECVGLSSVCGQNSVCNNTLGGYSCSCLSGFAQTNLSQNVSMNSSCQDINECVFPSSVCGPNSVCNNTLGGYSCSCLSGFAPSNLSQNVSTNNPCQDINECVGLSSVCGQNSVCNNTLGGYSCSCLSGFAQTNLSQNVSTNNPCQDINECVGLSSVCGQNSVCNNTLGGYSCSCLSGFAQTNLSQNVSMNSSCQDINECVFPSSVCGPNSVCNNTLGGYSCSCLSGFAPSNLSQNVSTNNPCQDINECVGLSSVCGQNSVCNNTLGGYSCSCLSGFAQTNLSQNVSTNNPCQDINECLVVPPVCGPNSVCNDTLGGYSCSCLKGFAQTSLNRNISVNNPCQEIISLPSTAAPARPPDIPISMSLKINENFDINLTNPNSDKFKSYKTAIEKSIDDAYKNVTGYISGSATVFRFRPGSVIADFNIITKATALNFTSANSQLFVTLENNGFNVNKNSFAESNECNLSQMQGKIYPLQEILLNCDPPAGAVGDITWNVNGAELFQNSTKYNILNNNHTLKVNSISTDDSGLYECITQKNSLPNIQWQLIQVQPFPNIQVGSNLTFKCENSTIPLQCCANPSYMIEWVKDPFTGTLTPPGSGCIVYNYKIQRQSCELSDSTVTFTCQLSNVSIGGLGYSSKSVIITATNKKFTCSSPLFGIGNVNMTATSNCDEGKIGIQSAVCNSAGVWNIIFDNCTLGVIQDLVDKSQTLQVIDIPQFAASLSGAAENNSANIINASVTLIKVVDLLNTIATLSQSLMVSKDMMMDFLKTVDVITSYESQKTWKDLNNNNASRNASSVLLDSIEKIGASLTNGSFLITTLNIQLNKTSFNNSFHGIYGQNITTEIDISNTNGTISITTIVFSALDNILPVRNATNSESSLTDVRINGDVVMIKLDRQTKPLISLSFLINNTTLGNAQCVFWNFSLLSGFGGWDSNGCELYDSGKGTNKVKCQCNHTTSFSILMSPFNVNNPALAFITYIGVGISMGCLVLCLIIECIIWKPMTRNDTSYMRHFTTVNVAASLLIADICFIIGAASVKEGETTPVGPCSAATFFIHFFYLALFFWMLFSALLLLYRTLMIFSKVSRSVMVAIAFTLGYGAPLIIAVITVAVTAGSNGYIEGKNVCWLNWKQTKALLAFVVPVLTIVAINFLVLIVVLCKMLKRGAGVTTHHSEERRSMSVIARCVTILTPLFGLTWGFGIGTLVSSALGIHIVFAVLNSLQGFFILVFGNLLDKKIHEALLGKIQLKNISSNFTGSTSAGSSSSKKKGLSHRFPRRYVYHVSEAAKVSSGPPSNSDTFKFIDT
ncbi:uncharacterized protein [Hoplias malabaricus]|uniref:uncharacterized protein isoform X2 n=1 Tax=Hoplias malabaricus TaxID=27720 RepID=UPI0034636286